MTLPDFYWHPYLEWCPHCKNWVISLNGHCINNDKHLTSVLTPKEKKEIFNSNIEFNPELNRKNKK